MRFGQILSLTLSLIVAADGANAQFEVTRYVIASGGGSSASSRWAITGTVGQPIPQLSSNDAVELQGGFWFGKEACFGDVDGDGMIGLLDLATVLAFFGQFVPAGTSGDVDGDERVDLADLAAVLRSFGEACVVP